MADVHTLLAGISYKIQCIISQNQTLQEQVRTLTATNEELKQKLHEYEIEINNLNTQINITKLRNTIATKGNATEIKQKINQMIRNIDKSLEQLRKID